VNTNFLKSFGLTRAGKLTLVYRLRGERSNYWATRRRESVLIDLLSFNAFWTLIMKSSPTVYFFFDLVVELTFNYIIGTEPHDVFEISYSQTETSL